MKKTLAIAALIVGSLSAETDYYLTPVGVWGNSPMCSILPVFCPLAQPQYALVIRESNLDVKTFEWFIQADEGTLSGTVDRTGDATTVILPEGDLHNAQVSVVAK